MTQIIIVNRDDYFVSKTIWLWQIYPNQNVWLSSKYQNHVTKDIQASLNIFAAAEIWNMFVCNQIWQRNSKHICVRTNLKCICWPRNLIYFQSESNVYMVNTDNKENNVGKVTQKGWNCYIVVLCGPLCSH